jgi:hypothetical protein
MADDRHESDARRDAVAAYRYALAGDNASLTALLSGTPCGRCLVRELMYVGLALGAQRALTDDGWICDEDKADIDEFLALLQIALAAPDMATGE